MAHFATTALIRKRAVEKRSEKHIENNFENSWRKLSKFTSFFAAVLVSIFMDSDLIFKTFSG